MGLGSLFRAALVLVMVAAYGRAQTRPAEGVSGDPIAPTLITLDAQNESPKAVFEEIGRQASCVFEVEQGSVRDNSTGRLVRAPKWDALSPNLVTIRADRRPFWEVVRDACLRLNTDIDRPGRSAKSLMLTPAKAGIDGFGGHTHVRGAFLWTISNVRRVSLLNPATPQEVQHRLSLSLKLFIEPRIKVSKVGRVTIAQAVDETGVPLAQVRESEDSARLRPWSGLVCRPSVEFEPRARLPLRIARLRGSLQAVVEEPGGEAREVLIPFDFTDIIVPGASPVPGETSSAAPASRPAAGGTAAVAQTQQARPRLPAGAYVAPPPRALPEAPLPAATLVTLKRDNATPIEVIDALRRATRGASFCACEESRAFYGRIADRRLSVDWKEAPFWDAFEEVCQKTATHPAVEHGHFIAWADGAAGAFDGLRRSSGPFVVTLNQVMHEAVGNGAAQPVRHQLRLAYKALSETSVPVLEMPHTVISTEAVDQAGDSLLLDRRIEGGTGAGSVNDWSSTAYEFLQWPAGGPGRITRLKGYAPVAIRGKQLTAEYAGMNKKPEQTQQVDGLPVTLQVARAEQQYHVTISVPSDQRDRAIEMRFHGMQGLRLYDAFDLEYAWVFSSDSWQPGRFTRRHTFVDRTQLMGQPAKAVLTIASQPREIRVPVEFVDVAVP